MDHTNSDGIEIAATGILPPGDRSLVLSLHICKLLLIEFAFYRDESIVCTNRSCLVNPRRLIFYEPLELLQLAKNRT
jgi:hypothetical protein